MQILVDHDHLAKVSQGVTCEVLGQDGLSYAPADEVMAPALRTQLAGWNGDPELSLGWPSVADYLDALDSGIACHAAYLVPQGTVRMLVVGQRRPARDGRRAHADGRGGPAGSGRRAPSA